MATINITESHTGSTISNLLSAFGPNVTSTYSTLKLQTTQSPVTAYVTSYSFFSPSESDDGKVFTLSPSGIGIVPVKITTAGTAPIILTASVRESTKGPQTATLSLTLSAACLSGAAGTNTLVSNTSQSITFTLTAVNLPFGNQISKDFFRRQRLMGII